MSAARLEANFLAYDKEWIACDNTSTSRFYGSCYLAYTDLATPRIALQVSRDGGATWGAPVTATSAFGVDAEGALPLVQPDGALTIVVRGRGGDRTPSARRTAAATFAAPRGSRRSRKRSSRCCARRRCRRPRSTRRADSRGVGGLRLPARRATATRSCSRRRRTARRGALSTRVPGHGLRQLRPGNRRRSERSRAGSSIVTYVRNRRGRAARRPARSASRSSARATAARRGRSRSGSTPFRAALLVARRTPAGSSSATTSARRTRRPLRPRLRARVAAARHRAGCVST